MNVQKHHSTEFTVISHNFFNVKYRVASKYFYFYELIEIQFNYNNYLKNYHCKIYITLFTPLSLLFSLH